MPTMEEIHKTVTNHLVQQEGMSLSDADGWGDMLCAYRGEDGKKCAIGCLISDEDFDAALNYMPVSALPHEVFVKICPTDLVRTTGLSYLDYLQQCVHDQWANWDCTEGTWRFNDNGMKALAAAWEKYAPQRKVVAS